MKTRAATAIEQQSLNYYATSSLIESGFKALNNIELDLESILVKEFLQGLPNDLESEL